MPDCEISQEFAHLRELQVTNQCEFSFLLDVSLENVGLIQTTIRAVRQITDTVDSLIQHIINKIKKIAQNDNLSVPIKLIKTPSRKSVKPHIVLKNLITSHMNMKFIIFNKNFSVLINAPLVKELKLPVVLYSNRQTQPNHLHILFAEKRTSLFFWYKSKNKEEWKQVGEGFTYKIKPEDVGFYLKLRCIPKYNNIVGPIAEVISQNVVEEIPKIPSCPFEIRHELTREKLNGNAIRVVSYNILSDKYAKFNEKFPYCSPQALSIEYRKRLIAKELKGYNADIICLQEVDTYVFLNYYKMMLKNAGYVGFYHRKGDKMPEGLACFFDQKRFRKMEDFQIIYSAEATSSVHFQYLVFLIYSNKELEELFMKQRTSLQLTVLKCTDSSKHTIIIIANTHLFYHPEAELVRILQINMATTYLKYMKERYSNHGKNNVCVIFCGDFNCRPTSTVYEYMIKGRLGRRHKVFDNIVNSIDLHHNFKFISACGTPKYTNYTEDFKDCLDYIFVEKNHLQVESVVPLPDDKDLDKYTGLPNEVYPSDHLALVANLQLL